MQKIKKSIIFCFVAMLSLVLVSCAKPAQKITVDTLKFNLSVADTAFERAKGLSGVKFLKKDEGMIFVFEKKDNLDFWMKNTLIPLQIIFVDGCQIVDTQEMIVKQNPAAPTKHYISKVPADKAIELNTKSVSHDIVGQEIRELCN